MASNFTDRKPTKPNRYQIMPENGDAYYATLKRADEPIEEGTAINAANLNSLVSRTGDSLSGSLTFQNTDSYYVYHKLRSINGSVYGVNAGCGQVGGKGVLAFELRQGDSTDAPRLARFEIGDSGVIYMDSTGKRTYLYESGLVDATVG